MASNDIPQKMRALVAPQYCKPDGYEIQNLPVPNIVRPDDCLVRVHAAAVKTGDTQVAGGAFRLSVSVEFPLTFGMEGSGVVVAVGSGVKTIKVGDEVMGGRWTRPIFPAQYQGWVAEYAVAPERLLVLKPPHLAFEQAAGVIGSTVTAYQSFQSAFQLMGQSEKTLEGKAVFVPGALSASGSIGVQLAKNVYGAAKVISTVSTPKLPLVEQHLGPGVVDQVLDYTKQDVVREAGRGSVDFVYNTQWDLLGTIPLLNPKTGVVVSIASVPPAAVLRTVLGEKNVPFFMAIGAGLVQWWYDWNFRGTNIKRDFISGDMGIREDLEHCAELIGRGKIKPVSTVVGFDDLEALRTGLTKVALGKGGLGVLVVKIV